MSLKLKSGFTFDYDNLFGEGKVTKADIEAFGDKLKEAHKAMNVMRETGYIKGHLSKDGQPEKVGRPELEGAFGRIVHTDVARDPRALPVSDIEWVLEDAVQLKYDDFGRRTLIGDPSAGIQTDTETWAADGSSTVVHTNRNGTITTKRDRYGRVTEIDREGEYATTYTYDSDGLLLGEVSTNGTSRSYSYDGFDRLLTETETVPDGKWLRKDYSYTSGSRVASIKYTSQSGEITTEHYTWVNGYNTAVRTQDGRTVWSLMSENELGLPTKALTGTMERSYSYTACGQIAGRAIEGMQDFGYSFSPLTGNLTARTDRTRSITENFGYDSLNRLTDNDGQAVTYAENGNITSMEAVGMFTYGKSSRPYQVTEVELTGGGRSASFTYNGSHERVKMYVADGTEAVLTRYYIGGRYELDMADGTTVERLYLDGDAYSAPMVMVRESGSGWKLLNIGRDHLGSVTHLATYDGTLMAEYSYDAWGRLRDPGTQEIYGSGEEPELLLGRGFTGHEHLPWFGLVNMNARLYDPALGRFLSPDPYIQLPDFTQNFNRYSYGLNNPLVYVDENGELAWFVIPLIVAGVYAIGNTVSHAMDGDVGDFWDGAKYFLQGAVSGFALGCLWQFSPMIPLAGQAIQSTMTYYAYAQGALNTLGILAGAIGAGGKGALNATKTFLGNFNLDENSFLGGVWQGISRHSWEIPQTFIGAGWTYIRNTVGNVDRIDYLGGVTFATNEYSKDYQGVTLGNYINVDLYSGVTGDFDYFATHVEPMYMHEYGHTIDSRNFGITYLLAIGLPSVISAASIGDGHSHKIFYTELLANRHAEKYFSKWYAVEWDSWADDYPLTK